ncbi:MULTISPECIES: hypothetical protein [unclassified Streptomyces]|nr:MULTISPECIES: hypothetical protein [unclassified Streptomyces]MBD0838561.1 hypothetical protein [Streptomyces sp. TRM68416]
MEAPTAQAMPADTMIDDAEFDLVIGELEQDAPKSQQQASTCIRVYCTF